VIKRLKMGVKILSNQHSEVRKQENKREMAKESVISYRESP
jgi:hypothetical protein